MMKIEKLFKKSRQSIKMTVARTHFKKYTVSLTGYGHPMQHIALPAGGHYLGPHLGNPVTPAVYSGISSVSGRGSFGLTSFSTSAVINILAGDNAIRLRYNLPHPINWAVCSELEGVFNKGSYVFLNIHSLFSPFRVSSQDFDHNP